MASVEIVPVGAGGLFQRAEILIDGQSTAMMRLSKPHRVEVTPGRHVVRARLRAYVSNDLACEVSEAGDAVRIVLELNERLDFSLGGFPGGYLSLMLRKT